jgi:hypothetical protein
MPMKLNTRIAKRSVFACLIVLTGWMIAGVADAAGIAPESCKALAVADFTTVQDAPSQVADAHLREAEGGKAKACVVNGYTNPFIGWRIWLPTEWNGKFVADGCGARCGARRDETCEAVALRGYACINADSGQKGPSFDTVWAIDNLQGQIDDGFRVTHVSALITRAVVEKYYGAKPRHAYYTGISRAGRQGLVEAQRFPEDFDGIVAGEPLMSHGTAVGEPKSVILWATGILAPGGKAVMGPAEIKTLHDAVLAQCDMDDGVKDGVVSDPLACKFDPGVLLCKAGANGSCLTQKQVDAVRALYAGQPGFHGMDLGLRLLPGSEPYWIGPYISPDGKAGDRASPIAQAHLPYLAAFADSSNADLRPFKAVGGKMILFQGWADELTTPEATLDYYRMVDRAMGGATGTRDFLRYFMIPGQNHVPGGSGAEVVDYLTALDNWVEKGQAPDMLIGYHLKDAHRFFGANIPLEDINNANILFTRPIYPYPQMARYNGSGDPNDWRSFDPVPLSTPYR